MTKLTALLKDILIPVLAILLTAYNVYTIRTERKDRYNDILYTQQVTATADMAEKLYVFYTDVLLLIRADPNSAPEALAQQAARTAAGSRALTAAYVKGSTMLPGSLLNAVAQFHSLSTRLYAPYLKEQPDPEELRKARGGELLLIQKYTEIIQRMREELGVELLNTESKEIFDRIQSGKTTPVG